MAYWHIVTLPDLCQASSKPILDSQQLLSHHRQHLHVDAVELIKARPGPRLQQVVQDTTCVMAKSCK